MHEKTIYFHFHCNQYVSTSLVSLSNSQYALYFWCSVNIYASLQW